MSYAVGCPAPAEPIAFDDRAARLTDEQVASFHENGFLSIPAVTTADDLAQLIPIYDRMFATRAGYEDGNFFDFAGKDDRNPVLPQILMASKYEPALRASLAYRNCAAMALQLLGPRTEFVFDHAMIKPGRGRPTPWHQDQAFWRAGGYYPTISFWIPFQDVDRDNGCLKFIPKSNHGPFHEHRPLDDDPHKHGLEAIGVADDGAVYCPLAAGGATVHHWLTCHGADANTTTAGRRAYVIGFGIRADRPLITRDYPWNRRQVTDRERRYRASLKPWHRLKQEVRFRLTRLGLL